jgi:hypothetical protein
LAASICELLHRPGFWNETKRYVSHLVGIKADAQMLNLASVGISRTLCLLPCLRFVVSAPFPPQRAYRLPIAIAMAMATAHDELPFWRVNVPPGQWPAECPEFLQDISEKDQRIIGTPDESYTFLTWDHVRELVSMTARPRHDEARRGTVCSDGWQAPTAWTSSSASHPSCGGTGSSRTSSSKTTAASWTLSSTSG